MPHNHATYSLGQATERGPRKAVAPSSWDANLLATRLAEMTQDTKSRTEPGGRVRPIRHLVPRPGRNGACNCGSGAKFKRCCGARQVSHKSLLT